MTNNMKKLMMCLTMAMAWALGAQAQTINGHVFTSTSEPVVDAIVTSPGCTAARTAADGAFTMEGVGKGSPLTVWHDGYYQRMVYVNDLGVNDLRIFLQIYLPVSKPILATIALFIGVGRWNDWFMGAYYASKPSLYPAATLLQKILSEATATANIKAGQESAAQMSLTSYTSQSLQMAFVMILTMPIVVIYPFLQKYFVKGQMVGSVKG